MIKNLFDPSKDLNRRIESVVTFADKTSEDLSREINEYIVTDNLRGSYKKVIEELQDGFANGSNEIGVWISGFYGSGKSSFAKYLGYSFDSSLIVDGMSFADKLLNRIDDVEIKACHNVIRKNNPLVVLIDLTTEQTAGKTSTVSDIIYKETMKLLGITTTEPKVAEFELLLRIEGKYDEFVQLVKDRKGKDWQDVSVKSHAVANLYAAELAPEILPAYFTSKDDFRNLRIDSNENETERFTRLLQLIKANTGKDKVVFVIDEVGQYIAASDELITSMQGTMQILKSQFKGKVWLFATAQQTLTEDNPNAQVNSDKLFKLNDRFPIKIDIEADDIKEIITKRLLGKSPEGKKYLNEAYDKNEGIIKHGTRFVGMERSVYIKAIDKDSFINLYPFLPVHIDILLALLQKLASRTGGTGLRSVIRLIRDLLVEHKLGDQTEGFLATPDLFYDALYHSMEKNQDFKEIVNSAKKAITIFSSNPLAVKACKTIAIMQLLDDFTLTFDNLCALLYDKVGSQVNKTELRSLIDEIKDTPGLTLQEIDGKLRFMTNAIITIKSERDKIAVSESQKEAIMSELLKDILAPQPSVNIFNSKGIKVAVDLARGSHNTALYYGDDIKLVIRYVESAEYQNWHNKLLTESTRDENKQIMFWLCSLTQSIDMMLIDVVRDNEIYNRHKNEANKEIKDFLRGCDNNQKETKQKIARALREAQKDSETFCQGSPTVVNGETYKTEALKKFAEQVYNKFKQASTNMPANSVENLFACEDKVPASLNPFKIVGEDGTINTSYDALVSLKDYIAQQSVANGSNLLDRFSKAEYGWSKDTTRYLVALMLKASMIEIRSGAQQFHAFTKQAAEVMKNNASFTKLGIIISTRAQLTPVELLEVKKLMQELFNENVVPIKDKITKSAYKVAPGLKSRIDNLIQFFDTYHLTGKDKLKRAATYAQRIIDSEGADAASILASEKDFAEVVRYVNAVDKQVTLRDNIKQIRKRLSSAESLPDSYFTDFRSKMNDEEQAYNSIIADADFYMQASDFADILTRIDSHIEAACESFYIRANTDIDSKITEIKSAVGYLSLSDVQRQTIDNRLSAIAISKGTDLDSIQTSVQEFSNLFVPMGQFKAIENQIASYVETNNKPKEEPKDDPKPEKPEKPETPGGEDKPKAKTLRQSVKKQLSSRSEVQQLISDLQELLKSYSEGDTIEIDVK